MRSNTCADCGSTFDVETKSGVLPQRCGPCRAARKRKTDAEKALRWRTVNPERQREASRRHHEKRKLRPEWRAYKNQAEMVRKYGLTMADFDALLEAQGGVCAICKGDRNGPGARFHVDHCHNSNKIRGLLCGRCNTAIGLLQDDPTIAEAAAAYLRR